MTGPLAEIRIVDVTTMISGPFATMLLGDRGAGVIQWVKLDGGARPIRDSTGPQVGLAQRNPT